MVPALLPSPGHIARALRLRYAEFRRAVRDRELWLVCCAAVVGALVGLVTVALRDLVAALHRIDFALPPGAYLSAQTAIDPWRLALVPAAGGLVLALVTLGLHRMRPTEIVDPVEANALYGGQMSLADSARLTALTVISNASGASVGMEAGYSQLGSGIFATVGRHYRLRREDQRLMVTAGAAAAIAAAFNAPLAGAFYGYELVHGSYSNRGLAPVVTAALSGAMVVRLMGPDVPLFSTEEVFSIPNQLYPLFALIGLIAGGLGILTMQAVTWVERGLRATRLPAWARPAAGGMALSALAFFVPQVLGSGHGAIDWQLDRGLPLTALALLLVAKIAGSALSLGAGFRGGLFSTSLFLGAVLGAMFVAATGGFYPVILNQRTAFMLVGMGAFGTAIIGAPFTMIFLVLEATGDFPVTMGVVLGVIVASTVVRLGFGYSFSTWRFHLRGLTLQGGQDIGWVSTLTAGRLMRADARIVDQRLAFAALRASAPVGAVKYLFVTDGSGRFTGLIDVVALHNPALDEAELNGAGAVMVAADLATGAQAFVLPDTNITAILKAFETSRQEVLPVLSSPVERKVLGYLSEAYCLKRHGQELERLRSTELGMPMAR
jgi:CIC family chloride channel protein